jgi:hypothetical protein
MSRDLQVAIDCADPHALNGFWAELMQFDVEHHDAMIRQVIDAGMATLDDTVELDGELWWRTAAACRSADGERRLLFQTVPEGKAVKNRVHIDVHAGAERDAVVAWCLEHGATKLWDGQLGPQTWVTLADPEGNEFCVS